jgi:hypothetical protein
MKVGEFSLVLAAAIICCAFSFHLPSGFFLSGTAALVSPTTVSIKHRYKSQVQQVCVILCR